MIMSLWYCTVCCQLMSSGGLRLFKPVQIVCLERGEAHVVAAGAAVARRAGGAGDAYFVGSLSDPVAPGRQKCATYSKRR